MHNVEVKMGILRNVQPIPIHRYKCRVIAKRSFSVGKGINEFSLNESVIFQRGDKISFGYKKTHNLLYASDSMNGTAKVLILKEESLHGDEEVVYNHATTKNIIFHLVAILKELHYEWRPLSNWTQCLSRNITSALWLGYKARNRSCYRDSEKVPDHLCVGESVEEINCTVTVAELAKPRSCNSLWSAGRRLSGEYTVWIDGVTPSYVYCDMDIDGGGWTVIQRRVDESTDFYRGWHEYKQGFGNLSKNFWLGLDAIHNLTERHAVLRIDITDHYGKKAFAKYGRFHIGNESTNYTLSVSGYEGNARDSLTYHNGMGFSTNDTDNDAYSGNCARKFIGAWWYKMCHYSNLNGNMMSWYHLSNKYNTIKYSEMKVREFDKPRSCQALLSGGRTQDGEYTIWIDAVRPTNAYCNMNIDGGGWTVIQRRVDASTSFDREWHEYKQEFGNLSNNFWLGLDAIHNLTKEGAVLRIDMIDNDGKKAFAKYGRFHIGNESTNYKLTVSGYEGNAGDSLTDHNGMGFSTNDSDDDAFSGNCTREHIGAWWYRYSECQRSNLNGNMMSWYHLSNRYNTIKYSEMKVRAEVHTPVYPDCTPCGGNFTSPTGTIEILVDNCLTESYCRWIITRTYDDYAEFNFQLHDKNSSNNGLIVNGIETSENVETMYEPFNEKSQIEILFTTYLYGEGNSLKFNYTVGNYSTEPIQYSSRLENLCKVSTHSEWSTWGMCEQKPPNSLRGTRSRSKLFNISLFQLNETTCANVSSEGLICESQANDTDCILHQSSMGFPIQISGTNCTLVKDRERDCLVFKSFSKDSNRTANLTETIEECNSTQYQHLIHTYRNSTPQCASISRRNRTSSWNNQLDETITCKKAALCRYIIWSQWDSWTSCQESQTMPRTMTRKRDCLQVRHVRASLDSCILLIYPGTRICPKFKIYGIRGNIARGRPTRQSSTSYGGVASRAVDGVRDSNYHAGSCTHTTDEYQPWWRVDLGIIQPVYKVALKNRHDCCNYRLRQFQIRIGDVDGNPDMNHLCIYYEGTMSAGERRVFRCNSTTDGRFVYVKLLNKDILTLCEVEVFTVDNQITDGEIAKSEAEKLLDVCPRPKCLEQDVADCKVLVKRTKRQCKGKDMEFSPCDSQQTATSCDSALCGGAWTSWGQCSKSCGQAERRRYQYCTKDHSCGTISADVENCNNAPCPVDGQWSEWSIWSTCNKPCRGGTQSRTRTCSNPPSRMGGQDCGGISTEKIECNFNPCPVHGGWGAWSSWSYCDKPCNSGKVSRERQCNSPTPKYGGDPCFGNSVEHYTCNTHDCKTATVNVVVKFTNETYDPDMAINGSASFENFKGKLNMSIVALYGNRNYLVKELTVHDLSNGSVRCNFTVAFNESSTDEILRLQDTLEEVRILDTMPVVPLDFVPVNVPPAPPSIYAYPASSTSLMVNWTRVDFNENITAYVVFYRKFLKEGKSGKNEWNRIATTPDVRQTQITGLQEDTLYTLRVVASSYFANGIASPYFDCRTSEGVPNHPPNMTCKPRSTSELLIEWQHLPENDWRGTKYQYVIRHREFDAARNISWQEQKLSFMSTFVTIGNLMPFKRYEVEVAAATSLGIGPFAWTDCSTEGAAPIGSPRNVKATLISADGRIAVEWSHVSTLESNGVVLNYVIYHVVTKIGEKAAYGSKVNITEVSQYATQVVLEGFKPYTTIKIQVAVRNKAGDGPLSDPIYIETCQCPRHLYASWYSYEPFIYGSGMRKHLTDSSSVEGFLAEFVMNATNTICQICDGKTNHSFEGVHLHFGRKKDGLVAVFENAEQLKANIDNNADLYMPIKGRTEMDVFQKDFRFVPIAENFGSVVLVKTNTGQQTSSMVVHIFGCWPILAVILLMTSVMGIFVWIADHGDNPEEFNSGSILRGYLAGFWWGFVTMTTVGYGDITPRSFRAKLVAMSWMLLGPILNAILIGAITTSLTTITIKEKVKLYGTTVAVKENSSEYNLAIRRNSKVSAKHTYNSTQKVISALERGMVKAALVDSITVAELLQSLEGKQIEVSQIIKDANGYGAVLAGDFLPLEHNFRKYCEENSANLQNLLASHYKKLTNANEEEGDEDNGNAGILSGPLFYETLKALAVALVCFFIFFPFVKKLAVLRRSRKIDPNVKSHQEYLQYIEDELTSTSLQIISSIEKRLKDLETKHRNEMLQWYKNNKYYFGIFGWLKYGTTDEMKIMREVKGYNIMYRDLRGNFESSFKKMTRDLTSIAPMKKKQNVHKVFVKPAKELDEK